jgi:heptaprenylglyceryl phosphate synthase
MESHVTRHMTLLDPTMVGTREIDSGADITIIGGCEECLYTAGDQARKRYTVPLKMASLVWVPLWIDALRTGNDARI